MRLHVHQVRIFGVVVTLHGSVNRSSYIAVKSVVCLPAEILDAILMQPVKDLVNFPARKYRRNLCRRPVVVQYRMLSRKSAFRSVHSGSF